MSVFTTNWFLKDDWNFLSTKRYLFLKSQITNENGGLILCDDKAQGCFGMWARNCWQQETNVLSVYQPSGKAHPGSTLQSMCERCAVLSVREQVKALAWSWSPAVTFSLCSGAGAPLQGMCCSHGVVQMPLCLRAVRVLPCQVCCLHKLCWALSAEGLVLDCPNFTSGVLGNLTFTKSLRFVNRQLPTADTTVWTQKKCPLLYFGDLCALHSACHVVLGFFLDHTGLSACKNLHWWVLAWRMEKI